ncbi:MAG: sigma-70 family RNA polymerase sigma factor [Polyangiaceae bacterium]|nr:sigma-70 family RNA polymerase sigma factor [Polyangiaceae bacterium]
MTADPARIGGKARPSGGGATVVRLVVPQRASQPDIKDEPSRPEKSAQVSDEALVMACHAGERWAAAALLERFAPMVERLLRRVLGHDPELEDLTQEALTTILTSIHQVREAAAIRGWVAQVAVHTAHRAIRKRKLYRWLLFWYPAPNESIDPDVTSRETLRRVYSALAELPADERIPFALRFIDEMPLEDVAQACGVSLATIKRRLSRAEKKFLAIARRDTALVSRIAEGDRWTIE